MDSHVTVNIVEPDSSILVPNTGGARMGELSLYEMGAIGLGAAALLIIILGIVIAAMKKKKDHRIFEKNKTFRIGMKKRAIFGIIAIVLCGVAGLGVVKFFEQRDGAFAEGERVPSGYFDDTLSIKTSDININVELDDENAFSYVGNDVVVETPTVAGYKILVYVDGSDLIDKKTSKKIENVSVSQRAANNNALTENTWGFAVEKPQNEKSTVWYGLSDSLGSAFEAKYVNEATKANDVTTFYYGVYVTPDLPYGTYEGSTVNYVAVANVVDPEVTFVYGGENVYFDEGKTVTYNAVGYAPVCDDDRVIVLDKHEKSDCEWRRVRGKYKDPIIGEGQMMYEDGWYLEGYGVISKGEEELLDLLNDGLGDELAGETVPLMGAVLDYFTITYDANGGVFIKPCDDIKTEQCVDEMVTTVSVKYDLYEDAEIDLLRNYYAANGDLSLLGWSEEPTALVPTYHNFDFIEVSPLLRGKEIKLYALWGELDADKLGGV